MKVFNHTSKVFFPFADDKLQRKWIADEQEWLHTSGVGADAAEPREWRRKGALWGRWRSPGITQPLLAQYCKLSICWDETHSKHFIASICKTSHRSTNQLKRKTNISFNEILLNQYQQLSIYSVRCQKISFRRTVRIRALTKPSNCTL